MSVPSVLTGEVLDARRRTRKPSRATAALAVAGGMHAITLLALMLALGRVPVVPEGPVGFEPLTLVFEVRAGPGGGGGGGGDGSPEPPTVRKAEADAITAPVAVPPTREPLTFEPEPEVVKAPSPKVEAPLLPAASGEVSREGLLEAPDASTDSRGPGEGGGVGSGTGTGLGPGEGSGIGEGQGGGFGGGAYRLGSGVEPPVLKRRVEPRYTTDALRRKLEGEVVLDVIILSDGSVGPVRVTRGLDAELDRSAIDAVRQWRFAPGKFRGAPVDVVAEIVVAFKLY